MNEHLEDGMESAEDAVGIEASAGRASYEPPRVSSGPIFERTVLASGCEPTFDDECDEPECPNL